MDKMAEKICSVFITEITDDMIPTGQRLTRKGFKTITDNELYEMLGCDVLQEEEFKKSFSMLEEEYGRDNVERIGHKCNRDSNYAYITYKRKKKFLFHEYWTSRDFNTVDGTLHRWTDVINVGFTPLDEYVDAIIPDECLMKVAEARELGVSEFYVAHPAVGKPNDPVIVGILGDRKLFITRWE